ncbi:Lipopolysaccharide kinase (Kdo/WaaP) family [Mycolicibacterium gilvum]|uniref:Lipopolysaccharide kinase (Kdo/WaaP) family n=1 Tax=Mycolicibacterium gilvum TaxID=1804 RepID=A0A379MMP1_9MYCO|nr:Lipopolysaccharide kinase (Kdo/WaaP) family [Mycolicibacterium gilvum]
MGPAARRLGRPDVALRDIAVGPSRHLVRFVESDGELWALKELPPRIAGREYGVLSRLEEMGINSVRAAGVVFQPDFDTAILLTRYLVGSWQYRRLFMRLPPDAPKHRARLFDAMATLLVELHRHGVFWGDCSLANTLFSRRAGAAGVPRRRRDQRGASGTVRRAARTRHRHHGGERRGRAAGHGRQARKTGSAAGFHRRSGRYQRSLRTVVEPAGCEADVRFRRSLPGREHDPQAQRTRLRRRRGVAAAGEFRRRGSAVTRRGGRPQLPCDPAAAAHRARRRRGAGTDPARGSARLSGAAVPGSRPRRR